MSQAMKDTLQYLVVQRKQAIEELGKLDRAIKALQEICVHNWISDGHDSHHKYEKCTICDKVESD